MSASARDVARAIDALRRGWPIAIAAPGEAPLPLLAVETADPIGLESFAGGGTFPLLISNGRAATLKLTNPTRRSRSSRRRGSTFLPRSRSPIRNSISRRR